MCGFVCVCVCAYLYISTITAVIGLTDFFAMTFCFVEEKNPLLKTVHLKLATLFMLIFCLKFTGTFVSDNKI